jgi:secreted trypsin-like serine protease
MKIAYRGEGILSHRSRSRFGALLLAAVAAAVVAMVDATPADAIANGEEVPIGKYRFSVKLTMTGIPTPDGGRRNSACSGALIAPRWVVTAGHCFRDANGVRVERPVADLTTATVGRTDLSGSGGYVATVVAVRQSPTNDLALAQIDIPIRDIRPLRLSRTAPKVGDILRLTGYGSITSTNPVPVTRLRTGQLMVSSLTETTVGMTGHAPARDTTPCPYDSGAPFFTDKRWAQPTLVSVVNFGPSCPHALEETTARVDTIVPWIRGVIG